MDHRTDHAFQTTDTIAALSTPTGEGGIGILRLSGPGAIPIALSVFRRADGSPLTDPAPFRQYYGHIHHPETGEVVDEVLLSVMRAPRSYTREAMAEISAHGGALPLREILALLCRAGARLAQPGEFTERAFLNGRIDLTQAEAVLDTIRASTDAGLRAAQRVLRGDLGTRVRALRERLIALLASLEVAIDYADEDITFLSPAEIAVEIAAIRGDAEALLASHRQGRLLRDGAATAIIGRPNTGKSSLLNVLLGEARAIVTEVPGTTRDVIEEQIDIDGVPLRLIDTAGIRHTEDVVERLGVARSRAALEEADLILLVLDQSMPLTDEDSALIAQVQGRPVITVLNKADLPARVVADDFAVPRVVLSTKSGEGIPLLRETITTLLLGGAVTTAAPMLSSLRQRDAAERAVQALAQALMTLHAGGTEELLAVDLMAAAAALGELTGDDVREEVIRDLFSRFCVGK
jgi:tRNA modification GTPase